MNKEEKERIIKFLEDNNDAYNKFMNYLEKEELDIEFILYEDEPKYFDVLWFNFLKGVLKCL